MCGACKIFVGFMQTRIKINRGRGAGKEREREIKAGGAWRGSEKAGRGEKLHGAGGAEKTQWRSVASFLRGFSAEAQGFSGNFAIFFRVAGGA